MPIDGTNIKQSIPVIVQSLRFPIDIALINLPTPECDSARTTVSYIRQINSDARFAKELVTWLIEEHHQRHYERLNSTKIVVQYEHNDMVMVHVQIKSFKETGTVGKLAIEARGPFRVLEDHGNGSYSVQPFNKPDSAVRNFFAQDMYALPPQILPCADINLPYIRYLNTDFAPVKHPFKDNFNIESYNSM